MKRRRIALRIGAAVAVLAAAAEVGCIAARRPNDIPAGRLRANPRLAEGQRVFMQYCNQCHVGGAAGLGPSLNDKPLPAWFVKFQVRLGLGSMPAFPGRVISNSQLDDVVRYLDYIHRHPDGSTGA